MVEKTSLRYGVERIPLIRSKTEVAARARPGRAEAFTRTMGTLAADAGGMRTRSVAGFDIVKVPQARVARLREAITEAEAPGRARPVFYTSARDRTPFVPLGTLYLRFAPGASEAEIDALLARHGCTAAGRTGDFLCVKSANADTVAVAEALEAEPLVLEAEPDLVTPRRLLDFEPPKDARFLRQWHLENRGGAASLKEGADARVVAAWRRLGGYGAEKAVVAVIDNGFDVAHPDFANKSVDPFDFADDDGIVEPEGWNAHGTACAGLAVAGQGDAGEVVGVAPNARLMPIRMAPDISTEALVRWFDYARERGAWVVSCSWSAQAKVFPLSRPAAAAIRRCAVEGRGGKGAVIVFAAGNDGKDVNDPPNTLNGFAIHPDVLAVAASTSTDKRALYSSKGREIAVCAPSKGSPGRSVTTADVTDLGAVIRGDAAGPYSDNFGGTSAACPVVAGVCALALGANPALTAAEVRDIIRQTARKIGDGYIDGHSPEFGYGCVDADQAVARALAAAGRPIA